MHVQGKSDTMFRIERILKKEKNVNSRLIYVCDIENSISIYYYKIESSRRSVKEKNKTNI